MLVWNFHWSEGKENSPQPCSSAPLHKVYFCTAASASQVFNWRPTKNGKPSGQHPKSAHRILHYPCEQSDNSQWSQHSRMRAWLRWKVFHLARSGTEKRVKHHQCTANSTFSLKPKHWELGKHFFFFSCQQTLKYKESQWLNTNFNFWINTNFLPHRTVWFVRVRKCKILSTNRWFILHERKGYWLEKWDKCKWDLILSKALSSWIYSKENILAKNDLEAKRECTFGMQHNWLILWMSQLLSRTI